MKISIFTSTYNRREKILRLINSVNQQDHDDWEILIVDDGSNDGTDDAIKSLNSNKIFYEKFNNNEGHPVAIYNSKILEKINGDIVIFAGSDDIFKKNAFNLIIETYQEEDNNTWKIGFLFTNEGSKELLHKKHSKLKRDRFLSNEIMSDDYVQTDYLFTYRKEFWIKFLGYFLKPQDFFKSFYDVAMNHTYIEKIKKEIILEAGWGEDNVTKGKNSKIYFEWALYTRKYLFDNYKNNMAKKYYRYTLNSLIRNLLISKGRRLESIKYIKIFIKDIFFNILDVFTALAFLFVPQKILHFLKKSLFNSKRHR